MRVEDARAQNHAVKEVTLMRGHGGSSGWLMKAMAVTKAANRVPGFEVLHIRVVDPSVALVMVGFAVEEGPKLSHAIYLA